MCERATAPIPASEAERVTQEMFRLLLKSQAFTARVFAGFDALERQHAHQLHDELSALNRDLGIS